MKLWVPVAPNSKRASCGTLAKRFLGGILFIPWSSNTIPAKSRSNKEKHGLDFEKAKALWDDPDLIEIPVRMTDEPRFLVIGRIGGKTLVGCYHLP